MAKKENDATYILDSKKGLPNKLLQADGSVTDIQGNTVVNADKAWDSKPALPNKWLNPDGTYSTLNEIIASMVDTSIYVIVDELPQEGDPQKIYLVPDGKGGFVEYHWTGTKWDPIGTVEIDLSNYSTTQEMMNAIEAAGVLTLNSAKAYTDEKIADIKVDPQVFYWDGKRDNAGLAFWTNLVEINKTQDVIVNFYATSELPSNKYPTSIIGKGELYDTLVDWGSTTIRFTYQPRIELRADLSASLVAMQVFAVTLTSSNRDGIITAISASEYANGSQSIEVLAIGRNYSTPYVPQYPGSPATKKYVDDSIATNITNVLNRSY